MVNSETPPGELANMAPLTKEIPCIRQFFLTCRVVR